MEIDTQAPRVARKQIFIHASPEAVWEIQANIDGWKDWEPDVTKSQLIGAFAANSVFKERSSGPAIASTLREGIPQQRTAWTGQALGSNAKHISIFKPENGGTVVKVEEPMEGWLVSVLKFLMPDFLEKSLDVWLMSLKAKAEGLQAH